MTYRHRTPCRALQHLVKCYWIIEDVAAAPGAVETVIPDGCMEMIFHFGSPLSELKAGRPRNVHPRGFVGGQIRESLELCATGPIGMLGVRFHPYGARPLLDVPMDEIAAETIDLTDLLGAAARAPIERTAEARDHDARFEIVESFMCQLLADAPDPDALARHAIDVIARSDGRAPVREVARALGVSERHLNRGLQRHVGLGAKSYARIRRMQFVLAAIRAGRIATLTDAAHAAGYFDQAHFTRDFRLLCGSTPTAFLGARHLLVDGSR